MSNPFIQLVTVDTEILNRSFKHLLNLILILIVGQVSA